MYICLCRGITDQQIQEAASQGARCNRDLNQLVGAPPVCGECGPHTKAIIQQTCAELELGTAIAG